IAFMSYGQGHFQVRWKSADGTEQSEFLGAVPGLCLFPASWADNGKTLVVAAFSSVFQVGLLSMEPDHKWKSLLNEKYHEAQPQISPDGKWMAYTSNESGQNQVYVRSF